MRQTSYATKPQYDSAGMRIVTYLLFQPSIQEEILAEYKRITASMLRLEGSMTDIHTSISALQRSLPAIIKYELRLDRLERTVNR